MGVFYSLTSILFVCPCSGHINSGATLSYQCLFSDNNYIGYFTLKSWEMLLCWCSSLHTKVIKMMSARCSSFRHHHISTCVPGALLMFTVFFFSFLFFINTPFFISRILMGYMGGLTGGQIWIHGISFIPCSATFALHSFLIVIFSSRRPFDTKCRSHLTSLTHLSSLHV